MWEIPLYFVVPAKCRGSKQFLAMRQKVDRVLVVRAIYPVSAPYRPPSARKIGSLDGRMPPLLWSNGHKLA